MAKGFHPYSNISPKSSDSCESNNNNTVQDQNMSSGNRSSLNLPLANQLAIPIYTAQSREEVETGGQFLLHDFIHWQFEAENLSDEEIGLHDPIPAGPSGDVGPQLLRTASPVSASTPDGYNNEYWLRVGNNIREIADVFANSRERPLIRQQADQVDLGRINQESFFRMLNEIFRNGINKECIVAVFFFCSDVLIRCVRQELREQGSKLFLWCLQFLVERVCRWVYDNGGWEKVFSNIYSVVSKTFAILALGVVISCGFVWIRKNW